MDHESVVTTRVVERYFLSELSPAERDAFEDHYFSCEVCAADVRATSQFIDNARALFREERQQVLPASASASSPGRARGWLAWLTPQFGVPALAAIAFAGVVIYQNVVTIPVLQAPRSITPAIIFDGVTRAAIKQIHEGEALRLQFAWEAPTSTDHLLAELVDPSGHRVSHGAVELPAKDQPFDVYFPGTLHSGRYTLVLRPAGAPERILKQFPFEIVPREMKIE